MTVGRISGVLSTREGRSRPPGGWLRRPGADGASATALQPPPHLLTTLPARAGGGRCGCHATAPAAAGGGGEEPGAAGGRPGRAARAGGGGGGAAGRARRRTRAPARQACPTAKPATAGPPAFSTVLRPARAAMTCRPRAWDGQRVAPVVPPAVEVVPVRHRRSRRCAERRVGRRSRSRLRAGVVRESTTPSAT